MANGQKILSMSKEVLKKTKLLYMQGATKVHQVAVYPSPIPRKPGPGVLTPIYSLPVGEIREKIGMKFLLFQENRVVKKERK